MQKLLLTCFSPVSRKVTERLFGFCFGRFCRPIMTKPKPVAKPEAPQAKAAADEEKSEPQPEPASGEEPMETEKPTEDSA